MKRRDLLIIGGILALALIGWGARQLFGARQSIADFAKISADGQVYEIIKLGEPRVIKVEQEDGRVNEVEVTEGGVRMRSASCPDQRCVLQGEIGGGGMPVDAIICLPNRVVIELSVEGAA